jgi:hypothetical protein
MYQLFVEDNFSKITLHLGNVSVFCGGLFFINNLTAWQCISFLWRTCQAVRLFMKNCPPQKTDTLLSCKVIYKK